MRTGVSLTSRNAAVLGLSILDEKSKAKFAEKYGLTFPLLADEDHVAAEKYGVWQKKSRYGRSYMGIVRTTYLIGPDGEGHRTVGQRQGRRARRGGRRSAPLTSPPGLARLRATPDFTTGC